MSKNIAVIGLGNTLRRDDGIGIAVLEFLRTHFKRSALEYLDFGTCSFDLIYRLRQFAEVLLIDGITASLEPGEVRFFSLDKVSYVLKGEAISTHELNLKGLFRLSKKLKIKTKILVAGIQVKETGYGDGLSDELKRDAEKIARTIAEYIDGNLLNNA